MRQAMISAVALSVLLASGVLAADDKYAEGEKFFKEWGDVMVGGAWTRAPREGRQPPKHTYAWVLNNKFIKSVRKSGEKETTVFYGLDPRTGKLKGWAFGNDGFVAEATISPHEKGWFLDIQAWGREGGDLDYRSEITKVDQNTLKERRIHLRIDGEDKGTSSEGATWVRKKDDE
jgi:hypothetical protein